MTFPLSALAGTYTTTTQYYGSQFSPLIIGPGDFVSIGGTELEYEYDPETATMKFASVTTTINSTITGRNGVMHFSYNNGQMSFSGGVETDPSGNDGPVGYSGTRNQVDNLVNWTRKLNENLDPDQPLMAFGYVWVKDDRGIASYDMLTGESGPAFKDPHQNFPRNLTTYGDKIAYYNGMYSIMVLDIENGEFKEMPLLSQSDGDFLWLEGSEGNLYFATAKTICWIPSEEAMSKGAEIKTRKLEDAHLFFHKTPAIANGSIYVRMHQDFKADWVEILDIETLETQWKTEPFYAEFLPDISVDEDCLVCGYQKDDLTEKFYCYDVTERSLRFTFELEKPTARPILLNGNIYITQGQMVNALSAKTGKHVLSYDLIDAPRGPSFANENGILFYSSDEHLFAIDTSSGHDAGVLSYEMGFGQFLGEVHGAQYLLAADADRWPTMTSIRLDEQVHNFYVETSLVRDFDFSTGVDDMKSKPNFQVELALFQDDLPTPNNGDGSQPESQGGTPRPDQFVRLTAETPTTVEYEGISYPISKDQPVDIITDGNGRARIAVAAGSCDSDGNFHEGLTAPDIHVSSPFMDPHMQFLIRPHGDLQNNLAKIDQKQLTEAKGYDSEYIVEDEYRNNSEQMGSIATAVNETASMTKISMQAPRQKKRSMGNMYCDPSCDMSVACCMPVGQTQTKLICEQPYHYRLGDGAVGQASFCKRLSHDEAHRKMTEQAEHPDSIFGFLDDLWNLIKTGAAKITELVVTVVDGVVNVAATVGRTIYQGAVWLAEHAVLLVQGIFNTIVKVVSKVVEAVSFLFDWGAILKLHNQIQDHVKQAWGSLSDDSSVINYDKISASVTNTFKTLKSRVDGKFQQAEDLILGSGLSNQKKASDKPNSSADSAQDSWLLSKFHDHAVKPTMSSRLANARAEASLSQPAWPKFEPDANLIGQFTKFLTKLKDNVSTEIHDAVDDVWQLLAVDSTPSVIARALASLIRVLRGLVDVSIVVVKTIVEAFVELLKNTMSYILQFVTKKLNIPFISNFYKWLTGNDLTVLDLFSLLVAIPAGFAMKLFGRKPAYASKISPARPSAISAEATDNLTVGGLQIAAGCGQVIWGVTWGILTGLQVKRTGYQPIGQTVSSRIKIGIVASLALVVVRGLFLAVGVEHGMNSDQVLLWAIPTIDALMSIIFLAIGANFATLLVGRIFSLLFGLTMIIMAIIIIVNNPQEGLYVALCCCAGAGLIIRFGTVVENVYVKWGSIVGASALIVASGAIEVAIGVKTLFSDKTTA